LGEFGTWNGRKSLDKALIHGSQHQALIHGSLHQACIHSSLRTDTAAGEKSKQETGNRHSSVVLLHLVVLPRVGERWPYWH
jgi:hypothetical protein